VVILYSHKNSDKPLKKLNCTNFKDNKLKIDLSEDCFEGRNFKITSSDFVKNSDSYTFEYKICCRSKSEKLNNEKINLLISNNLNNQKVALSTDELIEIADLIEDDEIFVKDKGTIKAKIQKILVGDKNGDRISGFENKLIDRSEDLNQTMRDFLKMHPLSSDEIALNSLRPKLKNNHEKYRQSGTKKTDFGGNPEDNEGEILSNDEDSETIEEYESEGDGNTEVDRFLLDPENNQNFISSNSKGDDDLEKYLATLTPELLMEFYGIQPEKMILI
jgi:hypothetical protein